MTVTSSNCISEGMADEVAEVGGGPKTACKGPGSESRSLVMMIWLLGLLKCNTGTLKDAGVEDWCSASETYLLRSGE